MTVQSTVFEGSVSGDIVQSTKRYDASTGNQVLVKITHSGITSTINTPTWCWDMRVSARPQQEQYGTHNLHQGPFDSHVVWVASFLLAVPPGLAAEHAAPLMCGGATIFEVIESYSIRPADRVGVVGIGGLGHLAIQFLAKIGQGPRFEYTAFKLALNYTALSGCLFFFASLCGLGPDMEFGKAYAFLDPLFQNVRGTRVPETAGETR
ncbi:hypothetical protein C8R43DRAFT_1103528 [Mycena crocata]|nr:hypothetical protein C8R43DRAFT_1103528 [Mycena crocata]